jgi:hypothetical protein
LFEKVCFLRGCFEADEYSNVAIATFESKFVWIWFVPAVLFMISDFSIFEARFVKGKEIQESVIKRQKKAKIC